MTAPMEAPAVEQFGALRAWSEVIASIVNSTLDDWHTLHLGTQALTRTAFVRSTPQAGLHLSTQIGRIADRPKVIASLDSGHVTVITGWDVAS